MSRSGSRCPAWRRAINESARCKVSSIWYYHQLHQIRHHIGAEVMTQLVLALVMLRLDYCNAVLTSVSQSTLEPLQRVQHVSLSSWTFATVSHQAWWCCSGFRSVVVLTSNCARSCTEYTLADARRISKTSSVYAAVQQHSLACDQLPAASTWCHGCEPSLENAPFRIPDLLHENHCYLTFVLQSALPCSRNYSKRSFLTQHFPPASF